MEAQKPYHVGIILDGNGRWATKRGKPRLFGHKTGVENLVRVAETCAMRDDIGVLSVYAFAIKNWKRDTNEVEGLWELSRLFFRKKVEDLLTNGISFRMIGNRKGLPVDVVQMIKEAEERSKNNTKLILQIALNYDGVEEVVRATRSIAKKVLQGMVNVDDIDEACISSHLDTALVKDPDILIRTGLSEQEHNKHMSIWRGSSFLQLQSAQSVCIGTPVLWPDFRDTDLQCAIELANPNARLFGGQRQ